MSFDIDLPYIPEILCKLGFELGGLMMHDDRHDFKKFAYVERIMYPGGIVKNHNSVFHHYMWGEATSLAAQVGGLLSKAGQLLESMDIDQNQEPGNNNFDNMLDEYLKNIQHNFQNPGSYELPEGRQVIYMGKLPTSPVEEEEYEDPKIIMQPTSDERRYLPSPKKDFKPANLIPKYLRK